MKFLPGLNIQFPISRLILSGEKVIETRTYCLPKIYIDTDLLLIETPGRANFKARATAILRLSECIEYGDADQFYADLPLHKVSKESEWCWERTGKKWGWKIGMVRPIQPFVVRQRRGIVFTKQIFLPPEVRNY